MMNKLGFTHPSTWGSLWIQWWKSLSLFQKTFPILFVAFYWGALNALGGFRSDHVNIGLLILVLSYGGAWAHRLRWFLLPLILTAVIYDSQRFYSDYIRGPIHVQEPYQFDLRFFGIETEKGRLTPNEWFQLHTHPLLDFVTGLYYLIFIFLFLLHAAYVRFWLSRKGVGSLSPQETAEMGQRMMWSFFWVNMIGYSTYYWYAAAPPWYVALHGLGPAKMDTPANPAGCIRFDELLGTHFFTGMYGRSADVFGAIPSLHVAYPFQSLWYALKLGRTRLFALSFYLIMCFSAVYLNHHYILDILWGTTYAVLINLIIDGYATRKKRKELL